MKPIKPQPARTHGSQAVEKKTVAWEGSNICWGTIKGRSSSSAPTTIKIRAIWQYIKKKQKTHKQTNCSLWKVILHCR